MIYNQGIQKETYIEVNNQKYQIDFIKLQQINVSVSNGCQRKIRRINVNDPSLSDNDATNQYCGRQRHKQRPITSSVQYIANNANTTQFSEHRLQYIWQFQDNRGIWKNYHNDAAAFIESRYSDGNSNVFPCMMFRGTYFINLQSMTQTNAQTGNSRCIRRIVPNYSAYNEPENERKKED